METDGPRRSGRVRKAVKSYAEEQAASQELATSNKRTATKRKRAATSDDGTSDREEAVEPKKSKMAANKDVKKAPAAESSGKGVTKKKATAKASSSKPRKASSSRSWHQDAAEERIAINNRALKKVKPGHDETRLREYVDKPAASYKGALKRATTQRMFVLDRERGVEADCHAHHTDCPCETIELAGSTGNVYTVTISHLPSCTCPVGIFTTKGTEGLCKHILYVLHFVFKASDELKKQNAFLTSELKELFANAPPLPAQVAAADDSAMDGNRKPVEDDCPICCMEFEDGEDVVWCRAACGNNIHKACFDQWANTKMGDVTCPFCRSEWEEDKPKGQKIMVASVKMPVDRGEGGYRNVRDQLEYDD